MQTASEHSTAVRTTCPYCGVGCGLLVTPDGRGGAAIAGDPQHPANFGRLCSKGSALGETLGLQTRLLYPMLRNADGALTRVAWDQALGRVADGFAATIARHGPDAVAFYLSGQLLTEDYYVANKLMKGFLGSANVDTNSRLCMASTVAGHVRAFGADVVPGAYADLDEADLIVLVGSNAAWCHPVLYQRMAANRRARGSWMVVIDPRRTASAEEADLHLSIAPGTDTALFCGLLVHLADTLALNEGYIEAHSTGMAEALARAREIAPDVETTAVLTGLTPTEVTQFFTLFRVAEKVVTCFSQGVNQSAQGTDKVNAIVNCHLATGRIGRPGMGPFSLTGQPNAMGGREVGGLANQLAAHMGFARSDVERVGRFWRAGAMAQREGLKAVQMFEAVERGEIRALWVMATNPAVSLPRADAMRRALAGLDLFVLSENVVANDSVTAGAHVLLPAAAWGEKDGTVTNSERCISRQRPFLPASGEARPDWWIVTQVARRMGFAEAFDYASPAAIFREHAALSAFENGGTRAFDIGALAALSDRDFDALAPVQWPARAGDVTGESRFFARGAFFTPDRKARVVAPAKPVLHAPLSAEFPLRLNTGRVRDQWHTMTRTGLSPRLASHALAPCVEVHPSDAAAHALRDGGFARLRSPHGECVLKVAVSAAQRPGSLFAPIHWSAETASSARVGDLVGPATDPMSGQPEAKATPVAIMPVAFASLGFALTRAPLIPPEETWWTRAAVKDGHGLLFASNAPLARWRALAQDLFSETELAEMIDEPRGVYRIAAFAGDRLAGCLFVGPPDAAPSWDAATRLFDGEILDEMDRRALLMGELNGQAIEAGPLICACFGIGLNRIRAAIAGGAAASVEEIGIRLKAGTNCGSCLAELKRIVRREKFAHTA